MSELPVPPRTPPGLPTGRGFGVAEPLKTYMRVFYPVWAYSGLISGLESAWVRPPTTATSGFRFKGFFMAIFSLAFCPKSPQCVLIFITQSDSVERQPLLAQLLIMVHTLQRTCVFDIKGCQFWEL